MGKKSFDDYLCVSSEVLSSPFLCVQKLQVLCGVGPVRSRTSDMHQPAQATAS